MLPIAGTLVFFADLIEKEAKISSSITFTENFGMYALLGCRNYILFVFCLEFSSFLKKSGMGVECY